MNIPAEHSPTGVARSPHSHSPYPPGPKGYPLLGCIPLLKKDLLGFFTSLREDYGDIASFKIGGKRCYALFHPDAIKQVLQTNSRNYAKSILYDRIRPTFGNGLVTSAGAHWVRQRRLVQPAFHPHFIHSLLGAMTGSLEAMLARWESSLQGRTFDIVSEMEKVAADILIRTLLTSEDHIVEQVGHLWSTISRYLNDRVWALTTLTEWIPTPKNLRARRALRELDKIVYSMISHRRQSPRHAHDLLDMLLAAEDEVTGEKMSDQALRDEVMTMLLAGHDTTALTLAWSWYLIGKHPEVEKTLSAEIASVLDDRTPVADDLSALSYTRHVIEESMRLYPAVPGFSRSPIQPQEISGYTLEKNAIVFVYPWVTHRDPRFWEDPEKFSPDRFAGDRSSESQANFTYFPFGGGPRKCIGYYFAMVEIQVALAMVVQKYRVVIDNDHPVVPESLISLQPRYGVRVTLETRT